MPRKKFHVLAQHLQEVMEDSLFKMSQADVAKMIVDVIQQERKNLWAKISSQINNANTNHIPFQVDSSVRNYMSSHILHIHPTQASQTFAHEQQYQLYLTMKDNPQLQHDDLPIWLALKIKFERLQDSNTPCQNSTIRLRDHDDPHDDAHPEGGNSAKSELGPSTSGNQEQLDNFNFWMDSCVTDDDELPNEKVSQELLEAMSQTVDGAKLRKVVDEIKKILTSPFPQKPTQVVQSCQRDPKAPALSLVNQDLLYLKKGNSGPEKIVLSLHKFPVVIFPDDDIEKRTSRWNPHAKIFYIKRQKEPGKLKEEIYSNSKIVQIIKTYGELGHEHKFITEIIAKIANGSIVSITKPDYKNLNKNDIEDIYLLIVNVKVDDYIETGLLWSLPVFIRSTVIWERVHDFLLGVESYQQKVNLTAPTIIFHGIEKYKMFSIVFETVCGTIYKNNKKEKRVMRHQEVHKFCDATLKRVLEGVTPRKFQVISCGFLCLLYGVAMHLANFQEILLSTV
ncbi:hypothetical protein Tco_0685545 [Tanacetum coccineum]